MLYPELMTVHVSAATQWWIIGGYLAVVALVTGVACAAFVKNQQSAWDFVMMGLVMVAGVLLANTVAA